MKKLVVGLIAIVVFGCGLYIYHVWFGNPFTKNAAEQKLVSYVKQTYPKKEIKSRMGYITLKPLNMYSKQTPKLIATQCVRRDFSILK